MKKDKAYLQANKTFLNSKKQNLFFPKEFEEGSIVDSFPLILSG